MVKEKDFIPALTGIRAICAYFIFFKHLNPFSFTENPNSFLFINQFYTFLTFFFVLSGFIICHKFYEINSLKRKHLYNYFINRFSRVFPVLFILTSITFLLQYIKHSDSTSSIFTNYFLNITLLKGFSSEYYLTGIGPGWSLTVEELFYFLSPLLFLLLKKKSALLYILLSVYLIGILMTLLFSGINIGGFFSSYHFTFYFTFFGRVFEFLCGIYLAMLVKGNYKNTRIEKLGYKSTYIGLSLIFLALLLQYWIALRFNVSQGYENWAGLLVNNIIMPIGITILFYGLIYHRSPLQWFLGSGLMVQLGNSTYSFYLLHTSFLLSWVKKYISHNLVIIFILIILFAFIFYKLVEQPIARKLRKHFITR
ncbi:MAG: acyltransferase [Chitinophagaceae bacterium]